MVKEASFCTTTSIYIGYGIFFRAPIGFLSVAGSLFATLCPS